VRCTNLSVAFPLRRQRLRARPPTSKTTPHPQGRLRSSTDRSMFLSHGLNRRQRFGNLQREGRVGPAQHLQVVHCGGREYECVSCYDCASCESLSLARNASSLVRTPSDRKSVSGTSSVWSAERIFAMRLSQCSCSDEPYITRTS
jgi:hypothetical protein